MINKKPHVYLGFKLGRLETIVISRNADRKSAIDCGYYIDEPEDARKQIEKWLSEL